jgi:adenylate cyclase
MAPEEHEPPRTDPEGADHDAFGNDGARLAKGRYAFLRVGAQPALLDAVRRLRRRLAGDDRFNDALTTTGTKRVEVLAQGVSTLPPERDSVAQEIGLAGLQVWQSLSEATGRGRGEQPLALMFTDLVDFSSWALEVGDTTALQLLREVGSAVEAAVHSQQGRIVKRLGDGLMAAFLDAESAVEAALTAQEALENLEANGYSPGIRTGVHVGRPRRLGGDYLGVDVGVAARVGGAAAAGEVLVSDSAAGQLDPQLFRVSPSTRLEGNETSRELHISRVTRAY